MAHIIVIDDDVLLRAFIREILERAGHEVTDFPDGREAVRGYARRPADAILCDLFMPVQEGCETIRQLLVPAPSARVIAMSGGSPSVTLDFLPIARALGAVASLAKPFSIDALLQTVRTVLDAPGP